MKIVTRCSEWKEGYRHGLVSLDAVVTEALLYGSTLSRDFDDENQALVEHVLTLVAERIAEHDFPRAD